MPLFRKRPDAKYDARGRAASLGSIETMGNDEPSPVVLAGIGSAGIKRLSQHWKTAAEYDVANRIAAVFSYDLNSANMRSWLPALQAAGVDARSVVPEYTPYADGFLRRPDAWMQHQASITADVERMIAELRRIVTRAGSRAQLVVVYLGYGGHARLGHVIYRMLREECSEATMLPVIVLPSEPALERNIRDFALWEETLNTIDAATPILLTDNALGDPVDVDAIAITALAGAELAAAQNASVRRLTELVAGHEQAGNKFLSVSQMRLPFRESAEQGRTYRRALFSRAERTHDGIAERGTVAERAAELADAIWKMSEPGPSSNTVTCRLAENPDTDQEQAIICVLPFDRPTVEVLEENVSDLLRRDEHRAAFPNTVVALAAGKAGRQHLAGQVEAVISKIHGSDNTPAAVLDILSNTPRAADTGARALTRGQARRARSAVDARPERQMPIGRRT